MSVHPLYVGARRVLLDALELLEAHREAIVVVGAQAVYLRAGSAEVGLAPYTTDGDVVVDADRLADTPLLPDLLRPRFHPQGPPGAEEPGVWVQTLEIAGQAVRITVDLIVPAGLAPPGGSRGARLGPHGKRAARKAVGLEAAIIDNDVLTIAALDPADPRLLDAKVAGPHCTAHRQGAQDQRPAPGRTARTERPSEGQGCGRRLSTHADHAA